MPNSVLVGYATQSGSTREVAEAIAAGLRECGLEADVRPVGTVRALDGYCAAILGAPLYMSHWPKEAAGFLARHRGALAQMPLAIFALGPCITGNEKEWQDARAQLDLELAKFPWLQPASVMLFGGRLDPAKLHFPYNVVLSKVPPTDLRDWTAIRAWANSLATLWGN